MGFYSRHILPAATHFVCSAESHRRQREKVVPLARGRVVEIGAGSGLNFAHYDPQRVSSVLAVDPSAEMLRMAERASAAAGVAVDLVQAGAEAMPIESASADTVLSTYTLCTIPDVAAALREMARILAPGGRLLFCEHGLAPEPSVRRWQRWLNPVWKPLAGGCHLDRDIPALLAEAGFRTTELDTLYLPGWRPGSYNYFGAAVVAG